MQSATVMALSHIEYTALQNLDMLYGEAIRLADTRQFNEFKSCVKDYKSGYRRAKKIAIRNSSFNFYFGMYPAPWAVLGRIEPLWIKLYSLSPPMMLSIDTIETKYVRERVIVFLNAWNTGNMTKDKRENYLYMACVQLLDRALFTVNKTSVFHRVINILADILKEWQLPHVMELLEFNYGLPKKRNDEKIKMSLVPTELSLVI